MSISIVPCHTAVDKDIQLTYQLGIESLRRREIDFHIVKALYHYVKVLDDEMTQNFNVISSPLIHLFTPDSFVCAKVVFDPNHLIIIRCCLSINVKNFKRPPLQHRFGRNRNRNREIPKSLDDPDAGCLNFGRAKFQQRIQNYS